MTADDHTTPRAWLALFALSLPMVALSVDMNGVVVLLPVIGKDLGANPDSTGAIVTVASIGFAAPLLLIGRIADRVGARPLLLGGVVGFLVASAVCAASTSYEMMIAGRALQGVASACCFTTSLAAIDAIFTGRRQPFAVGIWGALGGIGGAAGPLVASVLAAIWSWRAFFAVNIVLLAVAVVLLVFLVPPLPSDRSRPIPYGRLAILTVGIGAASGGLQYAASAGFAVPGTYVPIALGLGLLAWSVPTRGRDTLLPAAVSQLRSFRLGTAEGTLSNWGSGVVMVLVPTALQVTRDLSVLDTGLLFLGFSVAFAVGGALSGPSIHVLGAPRTLALSSAVFAAGMVALAFVGPDGASWLVVTVLAVCGLGNGVVYSASTSHGLVEVATEHAGEASAVLNMIRVLGLSSAVAISTWMVSSIDGASDSATAGLRVALLVAAAITVVGVPIAGVRRHVQARTTPVVVAAGVPAVSRVAEAGAPGPTGPSR